jgi:tyrosinase
MEDFALLSRRDFIKGVSALGAASLTLWAGGCEACLEQIQQEVKNRPTRKNIQTLWDANHSDPVIVTYKNAVTAMKGLPSGDQRNWENQADIHFNKCLHHNWLWLPWHRAYLLYLERICRKLTGDDKFALPYWNWNTHPAVPDPFWDTGSSLYDPNRCVTQSDQANSSYIGTTVLQNILNETNFELFASSPPVSSDLHDDPAGIQGMLEATPHNNIHGFVGSSFTCSGDMGAFHSPRDPVFYMHHCMLDCMWAHWNIDLGNPNTNDSSWSSFSFTDFVDENGNPTTVSVATTVLFPILTYQYEPCSLAAGQGDQRRRKLEGRALEQFLKTGAPSKLDFVRRFELRKTLAAEVGGAASAPIKVETSAFNDALQNGDKNRVVLTIGDVDVPEKRDFYVRVFVGASDVSAATSIDDPHYAGSFGFFSDSTAHNHEGSGAGGARPRTGFLVDVTSTLQKLSQAGSLPSDVNISLVPVAYSGPKSAGQLTLQRLELAAVRF